MKTAQFRVRPVIRHVLTRYTPAPAAGGSSEPLAECDNEVYAAEMAQALQELWGPRDFVIVERSFDIDSKVYYAASQEEADAYAKRLFYDTAKEYRVYSRPRDEMN